MFRCCGKINKYFEVIVENYQFCMRNYLLFSSVRSTLITFQCILFLIISVVAESLEQNLMALFILVLLQAESAEVRGAQQDPQGKVMHRQMRMAMPGHWMRLKRRPRMKSRKIQKTTAKVTPYVFIIITPSFAQANLVLNYCLWQ